MSFPRRQFLQIMSYACGSSFILPQNELAMAAQNTAQQASPAPPAKAAAKHESGGTEMEQVAGIGGLFFRAHDPRRWGTGISNTWGQRSHQRARAEPFGSKRPDRPRSVPFPKRVAISGILTRSGW
jgi:hypothetical protein